MRDIVRDAAIITVAKMAMTDDAYMSVSTFVSIYAGEEVEKQEELIATLSLFSFITKKYSRNYLGSIARNYYWEWTE